MPEDEELRKKPTENEILEGWDKIGKEGKQPVLTPEEELAIDQSIHADEISKRSLIVLGGPSPEPVPPWRSIFFRRG